MTNHEYFKNTFAVSAMTKHEYFKNTFAVISNDKA